MMPLFPLLARLKACPYCVLLCRLLCYCSVLPQAASIQQHAIEARIYAEDPSRNFAPSPGLLKVWGTHTACYWCDNAGHHDTTQYRTVQSSTVQHCPLQCCIQCSALHELTCTHTVPGIWGKGRVPTDVHNTYTPCQGKSIVYMSRTPPSPHSAPSPLLPPPPTPFPGVP